MEAAEREMIETLQQGAWIGEDGAMACLAKNKREALRKFKAVMRGDVGRWEAEALKFEDIGIGYARLTTEEERGEDCGAEFNVNWSGKPEKKTPYKVYVLHA
jgi:hypothetical protein